ncbi:Uu.00g134340.m01.CDS01 [Anthostomella pinea]|uniref:Uu.00g134340.m01.CDS01 n=1 Tax=Anthostomella pinea TaxID=933095 RepID=A0AAI8VIH4_9PEZI|nr:Uu.00g134340.m01.CDS01 [Anthostomella pinea]
MRTLTDSTVGSNFAISPKTLPFIPGTVFTDGLYVGRFLKANFENAIETLRLYRPANGQSWIKEDWEQIVCGLVAFLTVVLGFGEHSKFKKRACRCLDKFFLKDRESRLLSVFSLADGAYNNGLDAATHDLECLNRAQAYAEAPADIGRHRRIRFRVRGAPVPQPPPRPSRIIELYRRAGQLLMIFDTYTNQFIYHAGRNADFFITTQNGRCIAIHHHNVSLGYDGGSQAAQRDITTISAYSSSSSNNNLPPWKQPCHRHKKVQDFRAVDGSEKPNNGNDHLYLEGGRQCPAESMERMTRATVELVKVTYLSRTGSCNTLRQ